MGCVFNDTHLTTSGAKFERLFKVVPLFSLIVNTRKTITGENLEAEFIHNSQNSHFSILGHCHVLSENLVYMFDFGI